MPHTGDMNETETRTALVPNSAFRNGAVMINFDGAILVDIVSMYGPETTSANVDLVDVFVHKRVPKEEERDLVCEGCSYDGETGDRPLYFTRDPTDTMCPILAYCQECMEDIKRAYDEDPYKISAYGKIPGAEWFQPMFVPGTLDGRWKEMEEMEEMEDDYDWNETDRFEEEMYGPNPR